MYQLRLMQVGSRASIRWMEAAAAGGLFRPHLSTWFIGSAIHRFSRDRASTGGGASGLGASGLGASDLEHREVKHCFPTSSTCFYFTPQSKIHLLIGYDRALSGGASGLEASDLEHRAAKHCFRTHLSTSFYRFRRAIWRGESVAQGQQPQVVGFSNLIYRSGWYSLAWRQARRQCILERGSSGCVRSIVNCAA